MDTTRLPRWYSFEHRDNEVEVICTSPRRIYERGEYPLATVRHEVFRVYRLPINGRGFPVPHLHSWPAQQSENRIRRRALPA